MKYVFMDGVKALEKQNYITHERIKNFFENEDVERIIGALLRSRWVLLDRQGKPAVEYWAFLVYDPLSNRFMVLSHAPNDKDKNYIYLYSLPPVCDVSFEDVYRDLENVVEDYPSVTMA
ncbi:MAG: hypothetical protein ACTSR2_00085 [Candidatus Hodarchaeales archaeon]